MKTIKALSVAVSLLIAADGYVITQASAAPVPLKPMVTTDNLVEQVRHGDGRRGGGSVEWRRRHGGGSYMRHGYRRGGDYRRYGGDYRRYGYRRHGGDYRRYGYGNYRRHGYRRHDHDNNYFIGTPWLGLAPFAYGLNYGYGGYDGYYDDYPAYGSGIVEWCTRRYRSYNPATGMYFTGTRWRVCRPY